MTTQPARKRPGCMKLVGIAAAVIILIAIIAAITGSGDDTSDNAAPAQPTTSQTEQEAPVTASDDQRAADVQAFILDMHEADTTAQILINDPDGWAGYVSDVRVDGTRLYVRLQADRSELETRPQRAANWLTSAVTPDVADGLKWAIVEDSTGRVVEQKQFPN